jgi:hypothetical protein
MIIGSDLLSEKSLWQIYRQCVRKLPPSRFNVLATAAMFFFLILDVAYFPEEFANRIKLTRSLAEMGMGFGPTVLGFLIAGFTIFSTLSKPELFRRLYDRQHEASGLSFLKVNFFTFAEVFVVFAAFTVACLLIKIFAGERSFLVSLINVSQQHPVLGYSIDKVWLANGGYVVFSTVALYSLLALKSFIFNTYHTVMTSIVWSFNADNDKSEQPGAGKTKKK